MPRLFKKFNQQGIIALVPLLILVLGIVAGLYLVQHPQIFRPKATEESIQIQAGTCLKAKADGTPVLTCSQIQVKFVSPLETGRVTDASFNLPNISLVKPAYAAEFWDSRKCNDSAPGKIFDDYGPIDNCPQDTVCVPVNGGAACGNNGKPVIEGSDWSCNNEGKIHKDGFLRIGDTNIKCPQGLKCTPLGNHKFTCGAGQSAAAPAPAGDANPQPAARSAGDSQVKVFNGNPSGDIYVSDKDSIRFDFTGTSEKIKSFRLMITSDDQKQVFVDCPKFAEKYWYCAENIIGVSGLDENVTAGREFIGGMFKDRAIYTWWVDALGEGKSTLATSEGHKFTVHKTAAPAPLVCGPTCTYSQGGKCYQGNNPREDGQSFCGYKNGCSTGKEVTCPGVSTGGGTGGTEVPAPAAPAPAPVPETPTACANHGGVGTITLEQANCVLNFKKPNLLDTYKSNGWCADNDTQKRQIVNDWYNSVIKGQPEREAVTKQCFTAAAGAPPAAPVKTTVQYRYSVDRPIADNDPWLTYTPNMPAVAITVSNTLETKRIFAEFKDNLGNIYKESKTIEFVDYASIPGANPTNPNLPVVVPPGNPSGDSNVGCPLATYSNFDIPTLKQKCSLAELAKLPTSALKNFSNQDLWAIAKSVDGANGPYRFLSQFDNNTLGSFDLEVLKKLTEDRINQLPENLKSAIKGTGSPSSEVASCTSISTSVAAAGGSLAQTSVRFSGSPATLKIWVASNDDKGKSATAVSSWTLASTISTPTSAMYQVNITGYSAGEHAVLMSLHNSFGQMLDGNPGGVVNPSCATTLEVK